jgi:mRNA-degrading endonuclease RelE of RelBE toxin-antitoxin system
MKFRIADTFTNSLTKLTNEEQKSTKTTAFDLQMNPANPGLKFHKLDRARDPNFWSIRVSLDIRLIVHKTDSSLLLCYVGHHEDAYHWAERRKLETHPKTGAAQLVEVRETIQEIVVPKYVEIEQPKPLLFAEHSANDLLGYGVPNEWLEDVSQANEDTILDIADHLPAEAAEALLDLATGVTPQVAQPVEPDINPFDHPDALRRFRVMSSTEELERALDYPWEKWTVFLHPAQQEIVEKDYSGPTRISGSAGTGKTIVALHRAVFLARSNPEARILLTTFSNTLSNALKSKLRQLIGNEPRIAERLEIYSMDEIALRLYKLNIGKLKLATTDQITELIKKASDEFGEHKFSMHFLQTEWEQVVDAWQIDNWQSYQSVLRLGRKTRLSENQRQVLWSIFEIVQSELKSQEIITYSEMFSHLASHFREKMHTPFDFVVIDEAQDVNIPQLRFLAPFGTDKPNSLFFTGDLGQRIFQQPFSWKALRVEIRGRSHTLRINYRTSHQIRMQADRLLAPEITDVDGNTEKRTGTISVFNGPDPIVKAQNSVEDEITTVSEWLLNRMKEGMSPHEIGVFVRSDAELTRAQNAVKKAEIPIKILDENVKTTDGHISISTMHLAKGLEFRAVVVMACDDEIIPSQGRIETVTDDTDLEEVFNTERHLLYVACTRARDALLVTGVDPASEFLDDLNM